MAEKRLIDTDKLCEVCGAKLVTGWHQWKVGTKPATLMP